VLTNFKKLTNLLQIVKRNRLKKNCYKKLQTKNVENGKLSKIIKCYKMLKKIQKETNSD